MSEEDLAKTVAALAERLKHTESEVSKLRVKVLVLEKRAEDLEEKAHDHPKFGPIDE